MIWFSQQLHVAGITIMSIYRWKWEKGRERNYRKSTILQEAEVWFNLKWRPDSRVLQSHTMCVKFGHVVLHMKRILSSHYAHLVDRSGSASRFHLVCQRFSSVVIAADDIRGGFRSSVPGPWARGQCRVNDILSGRGVSGAWCWLFAGPDLDLSDLCVVRLWVTCE